MLLIFRFLLHFSINIRFRHRCKRAQEHETHSDTRNEKNFNEIIVLKIASEKHTMKMGNYVGH